MKLFSLVDFKKLKQCGKMTERTRLFTGYLCNIKCKFCFYSEQKHIDIKPRIYEQLELGKQYGIRDWDISGGEPPFLSYWFEILRDMKDMEFRNIACITNGYKFYNMDFLRKSIDYGMNEILFSLHGPTKEIHDGLTNVQGSFDHLVKAIENAISTQIKIRLNVVVTKDNYKTLVDIAKYANNINPIAFNFLPFRIENYSDAQNVIKYSEMVPYIKDAIDVLDERIKISIRYVPFCLFNGYEKYIAGYLQREFDEYEWNEYTLRFFDGVRNYPNNSLGQIDLKSDKWDLEIDALNKSIKHACGHSLSCLRCRYVLVCDGIRGTYSKIFGADEFKPVLGKKHGSILLTNNNN